MTLPDAFTAKTLTDSDCILWVGATNSRGYGCFGVEGVSHLAHRLAYEDAHGPIPDGMTIDHLCRVKQCVNPDHLEAVTRGENIRRAQRLVIGEPCARGHILASVEDIYAAPRGSQECRECRRDHAARYKERATA